MSKNIPQEFQIQFPMDMYQSLSGLGERGLMTPTYLSKIIMLIVLPATWTVKRDPKVNKYSEWFTIYPDFFPQSSINGLEILQIKCQNDEIKQYVIFYCGNGQDAMDVSTAKYLINNEPNKNYIFWNYPGVGSSKGKAHSAHDLFKAGYQQAKMLIEQGVLAENITLRGLSLGGGVATHVARKLHTEGHLVNLEIDRSFSRLAAVLPASIHQNMILDNSKQSSFSPLITSTVALAISGIALGTTFAGFVSSVGLVVAGVNAAIGYFIACCFHATGVLLQNIMTVIGEIIAFPFKFISKSISDDIKSLFNNIGYCLAYPFNLTAFAINEIFTTMAKFIDNAEDLAKFNERSDFLRC